MNTKHTCNDGNGPVFGRKTNGCPRCDELLAGQRQFNGRLPVPPKTRIAAARSARTSVPTAIFPAAAGQYAHLANGNETAD